MHYSPLSEPCPLPLDPFKACVAPRPIGWISTVSAHGVDNLAPFSQFQNLSYDPPMVMIACNQAGDEPNTYRKDTVNNIESTGCFVYNAVPFDLLEQMNRTAPTYPPDTDEFEVAGLHKLPSVRVAAKRVAESPIQFECAYLQTIRLPGSVPRGKGAVDLILGRVLEIHVDDGSILPNGKLDYDKLRLLGRGGYWDYCAIEHTFSVAVPGVSAARMAAMEGRRPDGRNMPNGPGGGVLRDP